MNIKLLQDIDRFFAVHRDRIDDLLQTIPSDAAAELEEELELLRTSIRNRLREEVR